MKTKILILLVLLSGCAHKSVAPEIPRSETSMDGVPVEVVIDHGPIKILYNTQRRLPEYVVYELTADHLKGTEGKRANKFIVDPILMAQNYPFVAPSEYSHSGYDRGHMAPSGDFLWDQTVNDSTFVMSNMAPQSPNLNRDSWRKLEDKVRRWACGEGKLLVITGPVLPKSLPRMKSGLEIPQQFFKIVIDETPPKKAISFLYSQDDHGDMLARNTVPVKNIESVTGLAFNENFPDLKSDNVRLPAAENTWKEADCE
ncbi:MAG: DNA/RNA non-specific endonuclease [Bacteriovorax sp.]|nr:DNA/RNA non-specific endonuclease [Bacteriovorax sp.]